MQMNNFDTQKPTIILFSGKSGSGKDYIANAMKSQLESFNKKVLITHYADLLKYICETFFDWDGEKDENGRTLLQHIGTDVIRKQDEYYWVEFLGRILNFFHDKWDYILIPDTRFKNEIEAMKDLTEEHFNVITVRVIRKDYKKITKLTTIQQEHPSETELDNYEFDTFDTYIFNSGVPSGAKETSRAFIEYHLKLNNKPNCFIDLDCTLFNTIKAIKDLYDEDYSYYSDYKYIDWRDILSWDFTELKAAKPEYLNQYFNQPRFFEKVEVFKNAYNVINELSKDYNIKFVSLGYTPNLRLKEEYIKKNFQYADFIGVNMKEYKDKSHINMENGVFIDDRSDNLNTSNAKYKICFGQVYKWNLDFNADDKYRFNADTWNDVEHIIKSLN